MRLSRLMLAALSGVHPQRLDGLRRDGHYPVFGPAPAEIGEGIAKGKRTYRVWDALGLCLVDMLTDRGERILEGSPPLSHALADRYGPDFLPGASHTAGAVQLVRRCEPLIHAAVGEWWLADGTGPDFHAGAFVLERAEGGEQFVEVECGRLSHIAAMADIVAEENEASVVRLMAVNVSLAWRRMARRAAEQGMDLPCFRKVAA